MDDEDDASEMTPDEALQFAKGGYNLIFRIPVFSDGESGGTTQLYRIGHSDAIHGKG
ncbi:unnamed protein product [Nippostrongylus brasiliensis]|uniref:PITH domain-containing protein n=1 Tax=Nippostrongylus brasiliensis TaxID=27835 RepID=A0A0N4XG88_NIPBR|nr:unnamed protein product [Nippostrongylus brasiliensis]